MIIIDTEKPKLQHFKIAISQIILRCLWFFVIEAYIYLKEGSITAVFVIITIFLITTEIYKWLKYPYYFAFIPFAFIFNNDNLIDMHYSHFLREKGMVLSPDKHCFVFYMDKDVIRAITLTNMKGYTICSSEPCTWERDKVEELMKLAKDNGFKVVIWPPKYYDKALWRNRLQKP